MVGSIAFMKGSIRRVATLHEDRTWTVSPPLPGEEGRRVAAMLADISAGYGGPSDGSFGPRQVDEANTALRALDYDVVSVRLDPKRPMPPGTLY